jgi:hypothetical protein
MSERFTAVFEGRADGVKFEHLSKPLAECVAIHAGDMTAEIERLRAALAAERERCAKSADRLLALKWEHVEPGFIDGYVNACGEIAAAIRNG